MFDAMEIRLILDSIRSAHNVGAIFRTADGAGVTNIYLTSYTPAPRDRFGRVQPEIKKTSLGATETVAWEQVVTEAGMKTLAATLHSEGFLIVAVEQAQTAVPYTQLQSAEKIAFVLGNEIEGVSDMWLSVADQVVEIPMSGQKESLNVATTAGIMLFRARDF